MPVGPLMDSCCSLLWGSLWCWGAQAGSLSPWKVLMAGAAGGDLAPCLHCRKGLRAVVTAVSSWEEPLDAPSLWLH